MLSYRHAYHAGNYADVLKHLTLVTALDLLCKKDKPLVYFDSHSGAGGYRLDAEYAQKTGEYLAGVAKVWQHEVQSEALARYCALVREYNPHGKLSFYPGSPTFAGRCLRNQDKLRLCELHSTDYPLLAQTFAKDKRCKTYNDDGFKQLIAQMPPPERRGLVLIDPSYEIKHDYLAVIENIKAAHKRFATGCYMLWYPVTERRFIDRLQKQFIESGMRRILQIEQSIAPDSHTYGMTAAGLIIVNPPWPLDELLAPALAELDTLLGAHSSRLEWLVGE